MRLLEHVAAVLDSTVVHNTSPSGLVPGEVVGLSIYGFTYAQSNLPAAHVSDAVLFCVQEYTIIDVVFSVHNHVTLPTWVAYCSMRGPARVAWEPNHS